VKVALASGIDLGLLLADMHLMVTVAEVMAERSEAVNQ
jgi:hypothetical protein